MCTHWLHWLHGQLRGGGGVCCTCVFAARRGIFAACARKKRMKLHRTWPLDSLPSTAPQVRPHLICCCWCRCSQPLFPFTLTFPFLTPFASCRVAGDMVYDQFDDDVSRSSAAGATAVSSSSKAHRTRIPLRGRRHRDVDVDVHVYVRVEG